MQDYLKRDALYRTDTPSRENYYFIYNDCLYRLYIYDDYSNIDFCNADFVSKDYLVLTREKQADVYKAGQEEPVILKDDCLQLPCYLSVFDDTLFYDGKVVDLKSGEGRTLEDIFHKQVIAKYGDSYIISDIGMKENFEKTPAEQLLN